MHRASRLDYAVMSMYLSNKVHSSFYLNGIKTDHSAFFLGLELRSAERGKSYWKMNTSILTEKAYVDSMNEVLNEAGRKYEHLNPQDRWEMIKKDIKRHTQQYTRKRSADDRIAISQLMEQVTHMQDGFDALTPEQLNILEDSKAELEVCWTKRHSQSSLDPEHSGMQRVRRIHVISTT